MNYIRTETKSANTVEKNKEKHELPQNVEVSSSSNQIEKDDQKAGASGTTDEKKPPMDGDRKQLDCVDGELLLVVRLPKDLVCNTNDQSEFTFELREDIKKDEP